MTNILQIAQFNSMELNGNVYNGLIHSETKENTAIKEKKRQFDRNRTYANQFKESEIKTKLLTIQNSIHVSWKNWFYLFDMKYTDRNKMKY